MSLDITLEQSLGSAVRYILDNDVEGAKAYFDEIPEKFYVPSVYFPIPYIEGQKVTLRSFQNTITFNAWVMARTDWDAEARAANLRDSIMLDGLVIPVIDLEGNKTGKGLKTMEPTQRRINEGIVCVTIPVRDYFCKKKTSIKTENFYYVWDKVKEEFG